MKKNIRILIFIFVLVLLTACSTGEKQIRRVSLIDEDYSSDKSEEKSITEEAVKETIEDISENAEELIEFTEADALPEKEEIVAIAEETAAAVAEPVCDEINEIYKIGFLLPLSGEKAEFGVSFYNGIEIAFNEINNDPSGIIYEFILCDNQGDEDLSNTLYANLVEYDCHVILNNIFYNEYINKIITKSGFDPDYSDEITLQFVNKYIEEYNEVPDQFSALGYDVVQFINEALLNSDVSPAMDIHDIEYAVNVYFDETTIDGLSGTNINDLFL